MTHPIVTTAVFAILGMSTFILAVNAWKFFTMTPITDEEFDNEFQN